MINHIIKSLTLRYNKKKDFYFSLKEVLGFYPTKLEYYEIALTHKSASIIEAGIAPVNNERLEYLGDAILDAIVGDFLYHKFPKEDEGFLTQMRSKIVNGENLSELAQKIGITTFIKSQISNPKGRNKIYEDAFEAFVGAIYLDKGFEKTKRFIIERILKNYINIIELINVDKNYKSQLIEWGQKYKKVVTFNTVQDEDNPKYFISYAKVDEDIMGTGTGLSKKIAEQNAAQETLEKVEENQLQEKEDQASYLDIIP